jgi:hypothetical protein
MESRGREEEMYLLLQFVGFGGLDLGGLIMRLTLKWSKLIMQG